jgi:hypothetical protein
VKNYAADYSTDDIETLFLYRDDGDGLFDAAIDTRLGDLVFSGDRYQISGLVEVLSPASRFFVAADIGTHATDGHHFAPGIPVEGIQVASANDGPVDAAAASPRTYVFENPEVVEIENLPFATASAAAGTKDARFLFFALKNRTGAPVTFDSLTIANATVGAGGQGDFDNAFSRVRIYKDDGDGVIDGGDTNVSGDLEFSAGSFTAGGLGVGIGADETSHFLVAADIDSFCAADGDTLRVRLNGAADIGILESYPVTGLFPAVTPGAVVVNGMMAHQIRLISSVDSLVVTSGAHLLLLDVGVPANGYAADKLQTIVIRNEGTATTEHFDRITLFADGGNETYDGGLGDDVRLGDFVENPADPGRSFLIAGLDLPLDPPCGNFARLYVTADIAQEYSVAGTIRFSIPLMGLRVVSGNDGPVDSPVIEPSIMLIPKPDRLTVFPYPVGDNIVYPGSSGNLNAGAGFYNGYSNPLTLAGIKFYQVGTASSAEIDSVFLHADTNADGLFNPAVDVRIASLSADGAAYAFEGLSVGLEPRKISYLFLTYDVPLAVTDAATVDMTMFGPLDITVDPLGSLVEGDFPVNSPGTDAVDGMIAAQIGLGYVPPFNASLNDADVPAMTLVLPPNGSWADNLEFVSVENEGTAMGGRDIASVRIWREAGGDPDRFDPGMEDPIDYLDWTGSSWTNSSPLGVPIPLAGLRVHVTFTVAASPVDGVTVRARLPVGGIQTASDNDGPIDAAIRSANQQTISTDPLIATLLTDRLSYSAGQAISLSLAARNEGPDTLYGVHPSLVAVTGTGTAVLFAAPSPASADMAPGSAKTFVWSYTADSAGDISFCARAYSGDSLAVSEETCTEAALIENRAAGVSAALANLAPPSANRGQDGVKFFRLDAGYSSSDPLGAAVELSEIRVGFKNVSGTPIAPNSVLSRITLADPDGPDHVFSVADSTNPVLRLVLSQAISMEPGAGIALSVTGDISETAAITSFSLEVAAPADIRIADENDGTPATKTTSNTYPWATTALTVNAPAETLLVDSPSGADVTANVGQENLRVFTLECSNPGDAATARVILTDLRLGCFNLDGSALAPEGVLRRLRVVNGATVLYDNDVVSQPSGEIAVALATPLVLPPGSERSIDFYVDLKSVTAAAGFRLGLEAPRSVTARDINTAELVVVGAADAASRDFPFSSDRVSLQNPASGIVAAFTDLLPAVVLPSATGVPVMEVVVGHESPGDASSVRVDSLALDLSFVGGDPAFPGDYFARVIVVHEGSTIGVVASPSSSSPLVECRLSDPIVVSTAAPETLSIRIDTKSVLSPAAVEMRLEREGLVIRDVNDGSRVFGVAGSFPFVAGPASLEIPSDLAGALVVSRVPANLAGTETNVGAFDLLLENGRSEGHTAVELRSVRVTIEGENGSAIDPTGVTSGARLVTPDSTVIDGAIGPSWIDYTLPSGLFTVASGSRDTLSFFFDIDTDLEDKSFRFVIEDSSSMQVADAVAGTPVRVGTIGNVGYPLATSWAHVLGGGAETAYTNYPNPFAAGREQTSITYYLDHKSRVTLKLYTLWGAPVATLVDNKTEDAGLHQSVRWDGKNGDGDVVANGVYYLVLDVREDGGKTFTMKRKVGVVR